MHAAARVILVGMMGSGKSAVGRALSAATGWPYVDNDEVVERMYGATAREILASRGDSAMRDAESQALAAALETLAPCIVAAAAGTVLDESSRRALYDASTIVWLRATAATLEARSAGGEHRPWIQGNAAEWIRGTLVEREPLYASVADATIDVDERSADEVAALIREQLELGSA